MKKIIICIFVGLVIIIGIVLVKNQYNHKYDYTIEEISDFKYYIYKDNNQYGVIDSTGKTVIEANYNNVIIPNLKKKINYNDAKENNSILNDISNGFTPKRKKKKFLSCEKSNNK